MLDVGWWRERESLNLESFAESPLRVFAWPSFARDSACALIGVAFRQRPIKLVSDSLPPNGESRGKCFRLGVALAETRRRYMVSDSLPRNGKSRGKCFRLGIALAETPLRYSCISLITIKRLLPLQTHFHKPRSDLQGMPYAWLFSVPR